MPLGRGVLRRGCNMWRAWAGWEDGGEGEWGERQQQGIGGGVGEMRPPVLPSATMSC